MLTKEYIYNWQLELPFACDGRFPFRTLGLNGIRTHNATLRRQVVQRKKDELTRERFSFF